MLFTREKQVIGLDIGSNTIKVVQISRGKNGYRLEKVGIASLEPEIIVDGSIIDASRFVDTVRLLLKEQEIKVKDAVISVSGYSSVIIKKITIPEITEEELSESIKWEAEQYIPFPIDEVNLDFEVIGPSATADNQMDVLLVAAKKEKVNDYISAITQAGLNPVVVDVDVFALENMYELNYSIEPGKNVALANIGASTMNINIIRDGMPLITRDSPVGGNQYTEAIQKELGITYEKAESLKKREISMDIDPSVMENIMYTVSGTIATEIIRAMDLINEEITGLILSGGCSKLFGLPEFLADKTGVPTEIVNPFKSIYADPKVFRPEYLTDIAPVVALGVGLAIRRVKDRWSE
ncbi:MAG: type IV pilus assembly protein PilM [Nitrospirota bacterium]